MMGYSEHAYGYFDEAEPEVSAPKPVEKPAEKPVEKQSEVQPGKIIRRSSSISPAVNFKSRTSEEIEAAVIRSARQSLQARRPKSKKVKWQRKKEKSERSIGMAYGFYNSYIDQKFGEHGEQEAWHDDVIGVPKYPDPLEELVIDDEEGVPEEENVVYSDDSDTDDECKDYDPFEPCEYEDEVHKTDPTEDATRLEIIYAEHRKTLRRNIASPDYYVGRHSNIEDDTNIDKKRLFEDPKLVIEYEKTKKAECKPSEDAYYGGEEYTETGYAPESDLSSNEGVVKTKRSCKRTVQRQVKKDPSLRRVHIAENGVVHIFDRNNLSTFSVHGVRSFRKIGYMEYDQTVTTVSFSYNRHSAVVGFDSGQIILIHIQIQDITATPTKTTANYLTQIVKHSENGQVLFCEQNVVRRDLLAVGFYRPLTGGYVFRVLSLGYTDTKDNAVLQLSLLTYEKMLSCMWFHDKSHYLMLFTESSMYLFDLRGSATRKCVSACSLSSPLLYPRPSPYHMGVFAALDGSVVKLFNRKKLSAALLTVEVSNQRVPRPLPDFVEWSKYEPNKLLVHLTGKSMLTSIVFKKIAHGEDSGEEANLDIFYDHGDFRFKAALAPQPCPFPPVINDSFLEPPSEHERTLKLRKSLSCPGFLELFEDSHGDWSLKGNVDEGTLRPVVLLRRSKSLEAIDVQSTLLRQPFVSQESVLTASTAPHAPTEHVDTDTTGSVIDESSHDYVTERMPLSEKKLRRLKSVDEEILSKRNVKPLSLNKERPTQVDTIRKLSASSDETNTTTGPSTPLYQSEFIKPVEVVTRDDSLERLEQLERDFEHDISKQQTVQNDRYTMKEIKLSSRDISAMAFFPHANYLAVLGARNRRNQLVPLQVEQVPVDSESDYEQDEHKRNDVILPTYAQQIRSLLGVEMIQKVMKYSHSGFMTVKGDDVKQGVLDSCLPILREKLEKNDTNIAFLDWIERVFKKTHLREEAVSHPELYEPDTVYSETSDEEEYKKKTYVDRERKKMKDFVNERIRKLRKDRFMLRRKTAEELGGTLEDFYVKDRRTKPLHRILLDAGKRKKKHRSLKDEVPNYPETTDSELEARPPIKGPPTRYRNELSDLRSEEDAIYRASAEIEVIIECLNRNKCPPMHFFYGPDGCLIHPLDTGEDYEIAMDDNILKRILDRDRRIAEYLKRREFIEDLDEDDENHDLFDDFMETIEELIGKLEQDHSTGIASMYHFTRNFYAAKNRRSKKTVSWKKDNSLQQAKITKTLRAVADTIHMRRQLAKLVKRETKNARKFAKWSKKRKSAMQRMLNKGTKSGSPHMLRWILKADFRKQTVIKLHDVTRFLIENGILKDTRDITSTKRKTFPHLLQCVMMERGLPTVLPSSARESREVDSPDPGTPVDTHSDDVSVSSGETHPRGALVAPYTSSESGDESMLCAKDALEIKATPESHRIRIKPSRLTPLLRGTEGSEGHHHEHKGDVKGKTRKGATPRRNEEVFELSDRDFLSDSDESFESRSRSVFSEDRDTDDQQSTFTKNAPAVYELPPIEVDDVYTKQVRRVVRKRKKKREESISKPKKKRRPRNRKQRRKRRIEKQQREFERRRADQLVEADRILDEVIEKMKCKLSEPEPEFVPPFNPRKISFPSKSSSSSLNLLNVSRNPFRLLPEKPIEEHPVEEKQKPKDRPPSPFCSIFPKDLNKSPLPLGQNPPKPKLQWNLHRILNPPPPRRRIKAMKKNMKKKRQRLYYYSSTNTPTESSTVSSSVGDLPLSPTANDAIGGVDGTPPWVKKETKKSGSKRASIFSYYSTTGRNRTKSKDEENQLTVPGLSPTCHSAPATIQYRPLGVKEAADDAVSTIAESGNDEEKTKETSVSVHLPISVSGPAILGGHDVDEEREDRPSEEPNRTPSSYPNVIEALPSDDTKGSPNNIAESAPDQSPQSMQLPTFESLQMQCRLPEFPRDPDAIYMDSLTLREFFAEQFPTLDLDEMLRRDALEHQKVEKSPKEGGMSQPVTGLTPNDPDDIEKKKRKKTEEEGDLREEAYELFKEQFPHRTNKHGVRKILEDSFEPVSKLPLPLLASYVDRLRKRKDAKEEKKRQAEMERKKLREEVLKYNQEVDKKLKLRFDADIPVATDAFLKREFINSQEHNIPPPMVRMYQEKIAQQFNEKPRVFFDLYRTNGLPGLVHIAAREVHARIVSVNDTRVLGIVQFVLSRERLAVLESIGFPDWRTEDISKLLDKYRTQYANPLATSLLALIYLRGTYFYNFMQRLEQSGWFAEAEATRALDVDVAFTLKMLHMFVAWRALVLRYPSDSEHSEAIRKSFVKKYRAYISDEGASPFISTILVLFLTRMFPEKQELYEVVAREQNIPLSFRIAFCTLWLLDSSEWVRSLLLMSHQLPPSDLTRFMFIGLGRHPDSINAVLEYVRITRDVQMGTFLFILGGCLDENQQDAPHYKELQRKLSIYSTPIKNITCHFYAVLQEMEMISRDDPEVRDVSRLPPLYQELTRTEATMLMLFGLQLMTKKLLERMRPTFRQLFRHVLFYRQTDMEVLQSQAKSVVRAYASALQYCHQFHVAKCVTNYIGDGPFVRNHKDGEHDLCCSFCGCPVKNARQEARRVRKETKMKEQKMLQAQRERIQQGLPPLPVSTKPKMVEKQDDDVDRRLRRSACIACRKPYPRCSVCCNQLFNTLVEVAHPVGVRVGYDCAVCPTCHHGGHPAHLAEWFTTHRECPVPACICQCMQHNKYEGVTRQYILRDETPLVMPIMERRKNGEDGSECRAQSDSDDE